MENVGVQIRTRAMTARAMVDKFLRPRSITDKRVLRAMTDIPRHLFVPEAFRDRAYEDCALPIGGDQTISQPYIVALMTQTLELKGTEKVLEIGSGSGYQTAILAELSRTVFSVERIQHLATECRRRLDQLGYHNVSVRTANGAHGWGEFAPFDRILVTATSPDVPEPLLAQLADGGRLVIPLGLTEGPQDLYLFRKSDGKIEKRFICPCSFVPFVA